MDDDLLEAMRKVREKKAMLEATQRAGLSGGAAGLASGIASGLVGGKKKLADLAISALGHGAIGAGLGAGSQLIGQEIAGPVDDNERGGHAGRGALGGAIAGGLGGLALGGLLGAGKLNWLKKARPAAEALLGGEGALNNIATDHLKRLLAQGKNGRLAATLGLGGAALGGAQGWGEGIDADYARSLENPDEEFR